MEIAIIGGGAAGCFCAIEARRRYPHALVEVWEAGSRPLAKVAVTGGGRCNLTNTFAQVRSLQQVYPRGHQLMKRLLHQLDQQALMAWWEAEGVRLTVQPDQCVFPASQDAMQVVHTLVRLMQQLGVTVSCGQRVTAIEPEDNANADTNTDAEGRRRYRVSSASRSRCYDRVVVTTGGSPKASGLDFLAPLHLDVVPPVPSLFTFNMAGDWSHLMGQVVEDVALTLAGTKLRSEGALLLTHWGMSGPAVLRLSSMAARHLADVGYRGTVVVNWLGGRPEQDVRAELVEQLTQHARQQISNLRLQARQTQKTGATAALTGRVWEYLLQRSGTAADRRCAELGSKQINRLVSVLTADAYTLEGQSRHKEEFVTCGGVALSQLNPQTLECRQWPGVFLAGEVTDVDAVTGGFNLQAAWTMGYVAARNL